MHFYCYSADLLYFKRLMWTDYIAVYQSLTVFFKCTCKPCDQEIINTRNEAAHTMLYFQQKQKKTKKKFVLHTGLTKKKKKKKKKNELAINKDRPNPHHRRLITKAPPLPPPPLFRGNKIHDQQYIKKFFFKRANETVNSEREWGWVGGKNESGAGCSRWGRYIPETMSAVGKGVRNSLLSKYTLNKYWLISMNSDQKKKKKKKAMSCTITYVSLLDYSYKWLSMKVKWRSVSRMDRELNTVT